MDPARQNQNQQLQTEYKHYCRVCKKGFGCGRALGGHMRAHGISGDDNITNVLGVAESDDVAAADVKWDDKLPIKSSPSSALDGRPRIIYSLRANPNRLKTCRACEHCGKEFTSWKSFLEHGKCTSDAESLVSGDELDSDDLPTAAPGYLLQAAGISEDDREKWAKGKRSKRVLIRQGTPDSFNMSGDDEDFAANCLVMLANYGKAYIHCPISTDHRIPAETENSCASGTRSEDPPLTPALIRTAAFPSQASSLPPKANLFECKACKKVFNSHQALGGHRASHKKVKGCFAKVDEQEESLVEDDVITNVDDNSSAPPKIKFLPEPVNFVPPAKKKAKMHQCSICQRSFETGQALGGHKRCHWVTPSTPGSGKAEQIINTRNVKPRTLFFDHIDLNLPAPGGEHDQAAACSTVKGIINQEEMRMHVDTIPSLIHPSWLSMVSGGAGGTAGRDDNGRGMDDEVESKVKVGKLSELKGMSAGNGPVAWLQVGIGTSSHLNGA